MHFFVQTMGSTSLYQFQNTAFMQQFRKMKHQAEGEITVFKKQQSNYSPRNIQRVQMVYDETARRFNKVLSDIKRDFLDKRKMKYIQQLPDSYSKGLELELYKLSDFYNREFKQTIQDVTGEETFGNPLLVLLPQLVMLSSDLVKQMQKLKAESRQFTESYLQKKLIQPNRFLYWQEIGQGSGSDYNTDNWNSNDGNDGWNNTNDGNDGWNSNDNSNGWDNGNDSSNNNDWDNSNSWDNNPNNSNNSTDWNNNTSNLNQSNLQGSSIGQHPVSPKQPNESDVPKSKFIPQNPPKLEKKNGKRFQ